MYILCFNFKNVIENQELHFLPKYVLKCKIVYLNKVYDCFSLLRYLEEKKLFKSCNLLESYRNVYSKSSAKRKCDDENVSLKADRALSKLNFLFHLKSKTNLLTLRKCNSHLQYYKIDLSFSIKLREVNVDVYEEHKTEREARRSYISEREKI